MSPELPTTRAITGHTGVILRHIFKCVANAGFLAAVCAGWSTGVVLAAIWSSRGLTVMAQNCAIRTLKEGLHNPAAARVM